MENSKIVEALISLKDIVKAQSETLQELIEQNKELTERVKALEGWQNMHRPLK